MIKSTITLFFGLVLVFFVLQHPDKLVELVQAFIDAAYKMAEAFGGIDTHTPSKG